MSAHGDPAKEFKKYMIVFGTLIFLTIVTVAVSRIDLGIVNTLVAMVIATVKALIVITFFMHMRDESNLNRIVFGSAFIFASIFYILTAMDVFTRVSNLNLFTNQ